MRKPVEALNLRSSHHHQAQCPSQRLPQNFHNSGNVVTWGGCRGCYKWVKSKQRLQGHTITGPCLLHLNAVVALGSSFTSQISPAGKHFHISLASGFMSEARRKQRNPSDTATLRCNSTHKGLYWKLVLTDPSAFLPSQSFRG